MFFCFSQSWGAKRRPIDMILMSLERSCLALHSPHTNFSKKTFLGPSFFEICKKKSVFSKVEGPSHVRSTWFWCRLIGLIKRYNRVKKTFQKNLFGPLIFWNLSNFFSFLKIWGAQTHSIDAILVSIDRSCCRQIFKIFFRIFENWKNRYFLKRIFKVEFEGFWKVLEFFEYFSPLLIVYAQHFGKIRISKKSSLRPVDPRHTF
jgi:hypothetical protein